MLTAKIGVVMPSCREPADWILKAGLSVRAQTYPNVQLYNVIDGGRWCLFEGAQQVSIPGPHGDAGNAARCIGAFMAMADGCDAIAFLDADNWLHRQHLDLAAQFHAATGAPVITTGRSLHRPDGSVLADSDPEQDGADFCDTSCMVIWREAFAVCSVWGLMPKSVAPICDRVIWAAIRSRGIPTAHMPAPTVAFRTHYSVHYDRARETPPPGCDRGAAHVDAVAAYDAMTEQERRDLLLGVYHG